MSRRGDLAPMPPSEGDSFLALAGAGCPDGEFVLRRLLAGFAPAAATWVKSQEKGFRTVATALRCHTGRTNTLAAVLGMPWCRVLEDVAPVCSRVASCCHLRCCCWLWSMRALVTGVLCSVFVPGFILL